MELDQYFEHASGRGMLATADSSGKVDIALYGRPHFIAKDIVAFIMSDKLSHANLKSNPSAAYLFMENSDAFAGKRIFLSKIKEEENSQLIDVLREKHHYVPKHENNTKSKYLVYFKIEKVLPLVGSGA
ncbi:MAG: pyridoxamine 5'-phosphate oxidase family protein [Deltaproteobacteria bacterium]|nr:pyridoxamine 5'-phosphate oxidase family protein [Deltaproteobacteria bacterium]